MTYEVSCKFHLELSPGSAVSTTENIASAYILAAVSSESIGEPCVSRGIMHYENSLAYEKAEVKVVEAQDPYAALELAFPGLGLRFSHSFLEETYFFEGDKDCKYSIDDITLL